MSDLTRNRSGRKITGAPTVPAWLPSTGIGGLSPGQVVSSDSACACVPGVVQACVPHTGLLEQPLPGFPVSPGPIGRPFG